jgi:hypothetical protein
MSPECGRFGERDRDRVVGPEEGLEGLDWTLSNLALRLGVGEDIGWELGGEMWMPVASRPGGGLTSCD